MISIEEAKKIFSENCPNSQIGRIKETDRYFIFEEVPIDDLPEGCIRVTMFNDGLKAVDKETGQIFTYNPIRHR